MLPIVAIIALVSFISVNVFISRQKQRRIARRTPTTPSVDPQTMAMVERVWLEVADDLGLTVDGGGGLGLRGDVDGVPCEMELGQAEEGIRTTARAHRIPEVKQSLHVAPLDLAAKARALVGDKGLRTGDPEIDAAFVVKASPESIAAAALDEPTRATLIALANRAPRIDYDGSTVELSMAGAEMVHENVRAIFALLAHVAKTPG